MMGPLQWRFVKLVVEHTAKAAYAMGHEDGGQKKPADFDQFIVTKGNELVLKKKYSDFMANNY